jgi:hypothetical protein
MPMPSGNRLDVVQTELMATGLYYRVHPTLHPTASPAQVLSPLAANPNSKARLALRGAAALGVAPRAMFYVATSPAAALLEASMRGPRMYPGRRIVVPWERLKGFTLSTVRLLSPEPYVPLMMPERGLVITDPAKDAAWRDIINTQNHTDTHGPAAEVAAQFAATPCGENGLPKVLPGFGYPSIQHSGENVFLFYAPPMKEAVWHLEHRVNLETSDGHRTVLEALAEAGFVPVAGPEATASHDFDPPPGAL